MPQLDVDQFEFLNNFVKFMMMMGAVGLGTLLFLGWWLFFSRLPWKDRLLLPVVAALVGGIVYLIGAETVGFSLMMTGVPWLIERLLAGCWRRAPCRGPCNGRGAQTNCQAGRRKRKRGTANCLRHIDAAMEPT